MNSRLVSVTNSEEMADEQPPRAMTLKEYMNPTRSTQPSCITLPPTIANFELKSGMIQMLPVFRGLAIENTYQHVREFEDICVTMRFKNMTEDCLRLRLFPFSLKEKAKAWLLSLPPGTINTWAALAEVFYKNIYSKIKIATVHQALNSYQQVQGETFYSYLERFKYLMLQ